MINVPESIAEKKKEFQRQTAGYISAAFGLIVGLAWNDAIKAFIEAVFPFKADSIVAKFAYAIILTLIIILVINWLNKSVIKELEQK